MVTEHTSLDAGGDKSVLQFCHRLNKKDIFLIRCQKVVGAIGQAPAMGFHSCVAHTSNGSLASSVHI